MPMMLVKIHSLLSPLPLVIDSGRSHSTLLHDSKEHPDGCVPTRQCCASEKPCEAEKGCIYKLDREVDMEQSEEVDTTKLNM